MSETVTSPPQSTHEQSPDLPKTPDDRISKPIGYIARVAAHMGEPKNPDLSSLPRNNDKREMLRILAPQNRAERLLNFLPKFREGDDKEKIVSAEEALATSQALAEIAEGLLRDSRNGIGIGSGFEEIARFYLPQIDESRVNIGVVMRPDGPLYRDRGVIVPRVRLDLSTSDDKGSYSSSLDTYTYEVTEPKDGAKRRVDVSDSNGFPDHTFIAAEMSEIEGIRTLLESFSIKEAPKYNPKKAFKRR